MGKIFAACGIAVVASGGLRIPAHLDLNQRGTCKVCGSSRLWWADYNDACKRGGLIRVQRPDGARVKFDICADCMTLRVVDIRSADDKIA